MASYELDTFTPYPAVRIVVASELILPSSIKLLFFAIDPEQQIDWQDYASSKPQRSFNDSLGYQRQDFLWEQTCFELFVGIKDQDCYREINLSPQQYWNCYAFEDYRQPEQTPPQIASDIELISFQCSHLKVQAILNLQTFIEQQDCYLEDLKLGISSVIRLKNGKQLFFALQHSGKQADFHRRQDWVATTT